MLVCGVNLSLIVAYLMTHRDAVLFELKTESPLLRSPGSRVDGRFLLHPDDSTLVQGPDPREGAGLSLWMGKEWPGVGLVDPGTRLRGSISGGELEPIQLDFTVGYNQKRYPATLIAVRRRGNPTFRGLIVIHAREGVGVPPSISHDPAPSLTTGTMLSARWIWTATYDGDGS